MSKFKFDPKQSELVGKALDGLKEKGGLSELSNNVLGQFGRFGRYFGRFGRVIIVIGHA